MDQNLFLATFCKELYKGIDLFALLETDRFFHLGDLTVSCDYARQGLATKLYQLSLEIAVKLGVPAAKTYAASTYTAKLAAKLGFSTFNTVDYATLEHKGTMPFTKYPDVLVDHPSVLLMARRLP